MKRPLITGVLTLFVGLGGMQFPAGGAFDPPIPPTTQPGGGPTTQPADQPADEPTTQPTTRPGGSPILAAMERLKAGFGKPASDDDAPDEAGEDEGDDQQASADASAEASPEASVRPRDAEGKAIPSPAELMRQMREAREAEAAKALVAHIDMSSPVMEQPSGFSLFGGPTGIDLRGVLSRLEQAREDESCHAVLLTFYNGGLMNMAQAQEIRRELGKLKKAGKRTFIYADTYDTVSYLIASAATDVCLMDGGEVFMPGVMIEPMFYRGTLDKLGVKPDYVQIGEYKGAEEPYTRTEPSPELAAEMEQLVDAIHGEIVRQIARGRGNKKEKVAVLIDDAMIPAKKARLNGLVDHLVDADGLRGLMSESLEEEELRIDASYGSDRDEIDSDNPLAVFAAMSQAQNQRVSTTGPSIALVYAEGVITGGEGGSDGLLGESGIGSERIRRAMRMAERDDNIKAIVVRIDSPGGSALASEAMYQAVRRVAETKPVIISVGSMAASGGYYLACAGDTIVADPSAIVGSIGVVGGKLVLGGLYDKLGLSTASFSRGANADIYSSTDPWSDEQRELIRKWMTSTYELFTERVMESRGRKITDVDAVARGRIFLARDARKLGMVDRLGGIEDAINIAARRAEMGEEYDVVTVPENQFNPLNQNLTIPLGQAPGIHVNVELSAEAAGLIQLLPPHLREALSRTVELGKLLEDRPVVLMTPYLIRVR